MLVINSAYGRRRGPGLLLPVFLLLALSAAGCVNSGSAAPAHPDGPGATQPAAGAAVEQGSWRRIKEAPIPPTSGMAAAWTGRQLVVWGGQAGGGARPASAGRAADAPRPAP